VDAFLDFFGLERKRRGGQRVLIDWPVDIQVPGKDSYVAFLGRDLSTKGMSLDGPSIVWMDLGVSRDKDTRIRIRVPFKDFKIEAEVKLKWTLVEKDVTTTGWEFILPLKHEDQQFITEYIKEHIGKS
jgi:hypothetical protein